MSGIAGLFGGSSAKTDRKQELDARDQLRNVFSYALPEGKKDEATGSSLSNDAGDYFSRVLRAGRTETAESAAPAINANLSAADAVKRREALTGTGRTGGTVEADRTAEAGTDANTANIINETGIKNKAVAAQGAAQVGSDQMRQSLGLLGLSGAQIDYLLGETMQSRKNSDTIRNNTYDRVASDIGNIASYDWLPGTSGDQSLLSGAGKLLSNFF